MDTTEFDKSISLLRAAAAAAVGGGKAIAATQAGLGKNPAIALLEHLKEIETHAADAVKHASELRAQCRSGREA